jgi:CBS domain-containing protein
MKNQIKDIYRKIIQRYKKFTSQSQFEYEELLQEIPSLYPFSSVVEAMETFKKYEVSAIPVVSIDYEVIGIITERDIAHLISLQSIVGWSALKNYSVDTLYLNSTNIVNIEASLEEVAVEFTGKNVEIVPLIDENGKYSGYCITAAKLISYTSNSIKPRTIGGLATPLGVYLTDGVFYSGAGLPGLIATGIAFGMLINIISLLAIIFLEPYKLPQSLMLVIELSLFLLILRLSPLSGYHAAEHQTIHAIEKGLELTMENVKKQPKEHERCGTNIMILVLGLSLMFMLSFEYLQYLGMLEQTLILVVFSVILFSNWKKLGNKLQGVFTTARATDSQLMSGIKAGQELLKFYENNTRPLKISASQKMWNMGIFQVLITFTIVSIIFQIILSYLWPSL